MTNYATKGDCSQYQRVMSAAFVRKAYEEAVDKRLVNAPTGAVRVLDIDKFALRAFNRLAYDREISGPLIANTLLDLPEFYTPHKTIRRVNLQALRRKFVKWFLRRALKGTLQMISFASKDQKKYLLFPSTITIIEGQNWHYILFMTTKKSLQSLHLLQC